jgi:hypothetical protein
VDPRVEKINHFSGGSNSYEIPVFQRNYEWGPEKWAYLWHDIKSLYIQANYRLNKESKISLEDALLPRHFIGTMLSRSLSPLGNGLGSKYTVIDGQQRLITIFILLSAIRDHSLGPNKDTGPNDPLAIIEGREKRFRRLEVNKIDAKIFENVVFGIYKDGMKTSDAKTRLGQAYIYFRWQLWNGLNNYLSDEPDLTNLDPPKPRKRKDSPAEGDFTKYWPALEKTTQYNLELLENCINYGLEVLEIILQPHDEDDAIIFETINARGTPLEKFDLIKNSFFLRLSDSAVDFFNSDWFGFESRLTKFCETQKVKKDQFIYDYLVFIGVEKVSHAKLYTKWQNYVREQIGALGGDKLGEMFKEIIAKPLIDSAELYPASWGLSIELHLGNVSKKIPQETIILIKEIVEMTSTTIPFHMMAIEGWLKGKLTDSDLHLWFRKIQGFLIRMVLAGQKLNNLRAGILAASPKLHNEITIAKLNLILRETLNQVTDIELKNSISNSKCALNENAKSMMIIFRGIEKGLKVDVGVAHPMPHGQEKTDWQIEHIYPQSEKSPGKKWLEDISKWDFKKDNYDELKFTLGNVTVITSTGNQNLGQKPFAEKKVKYKDTKLDINSGFARLQKWTPKMIQDRSTELLSEILDAWPY